MTSVEYEYYDETETKIKRKVWKENGVRHRLDGPAVIGYYKSGMAMVKVWFVDGKTHRLDGPAGIQYYESGCVKCESWRVDGKKHRLDGPAGIRYYKSGKINIKEWYSNGKLHRLDGPACIGYYHFDRINFASWWVGGNMYSLKEFNKIVKILNKLTWSIRLNKIKKTRGLIEWYYGPNGLGGRQDRQNLRKFVMGIQL